MGRQVKYTRDANMDLDGVHDYIVESFYSKSIASATLARIVAGIKVLKVSPDIGVSLDRKLVRKIHPHYEIKMLILDQYLVFYTVTDQYVFVLRVLNVKQDFMKFLNRFSALADRNEV